MRAGATLPRGCSLTCVFFSTSRDIFTQLGIVECNADSNEPGAHIFAFRLIKDDEPGLARRHRDAQLRAWVEISIYLEDWRSRHKSKYKSGQDARTLLLRTEPR